MPWSMYVSMARKITIGHCGHKTNKPNTWKDFNACAAYLINNQYTSNAMLACESRNAGGILIGTAITERPNLYKVAIIKRGRINPLRSAVKPNGEGKFRNLEPWPAP